MQALLDFSFTKFVSPSIVRIVYILVMVLLAIDYLTWVVLGFQLNAFVGVLVLIIVGPIFTLVSLAFARMGLEVLIAVIRTAENTAGLAPLNAGGLSAASGKAYGPPNQTPPAYGPPPQRPPAPQAS